MSGEQPHLRNELGLTFRQAEDPVFFFDFDGVLSEIVPIVDDAEPVEGALQMIVALIEGGSAVSIVSSRPVEFLLKHFPVDSTEALSGLSLFGSKGLASYVDGKYREIGDAAEWRERIQNALAAVEKLTTGARSEGLLLEDKGLSFGIHYRNCRDLEPEAHWIAERVAGQFGLLVEAGKMVYELEPKASISKGTVVTSEMGSHDWAMFAGDDVGDFPAFKVLGRYRALGRHAFRVGVMSRESPAAIVDEVDIHVSYPGELQELVLSLTRGSM